MRKLAFLVGVAVGYVLGARAGRERYEQIRKSARDLGQTPVAQQAARVARDKAGAAAGRAAGKLPSPLADRVPYLRRKAERDEGWDTAER